MLARFFIDRPVFAWVLSIVIILIGGVAAFLLPIDMYPEITPPTVQVSAHYPGADAQVVADVIAAPIEQQINGVENMLYMSSQSTNDGNYSLTVTFQIGTDVNAAQVLVQNRVALALPQLPSQVQLQGVSVRKSSPNILFAVNLISPDGRYDDLYMSNYATIHLRDELRESTAWAMCASSASAATRCASGSIRKNLRRAISRRWTWSTPCGPRTCRWPRGRLASSRCRRGSGFSIR